MEGIAGDSILRCARGHLFTSTETARLFDSAHPGSEMQLLAARNHHT